MNSFDKLKSDAEQAAKEQENRKARLKELEESKQSGFHPFKAAEKRKEIKSLNKEISEYNQKKNSVIGFSVLAGIIVICLIMVGISSLIDGKSQDSSPEITEASEPAIDNNSIVETPPTSTPAESKMTDNAEPIVAPETKTPTSVEEAPKEEYDGIPLSIDNLSVTYQCDYSHTDMDIIRLGNDESATIEITTSVPNVSLDDIVLVFDEDMLSVQTSTESETRFKVKITGKQEGYSQFGILTYYDIFEFGEDSKAFIIDVHKLSKSDGRVAYVTPTGEKYHLSASCAGENAIKTTYSDCLAYDYEPCGVCAK